MSKDIFSKYKFIKKIANLVEEIWLYGSRARGDDLERSDIDLAVVAPFATKQDELTIQNIIDEADTLLKIDLVIFNKVLDSSFKKRIEKEKIIIYKKSDVSKN